MLIIPRMELEDRGKEGEVKTCPSNLTKEEVAVHIWMFL
jgi:hypothetical protein